MGGVYAHESGVWAGDIAVIIREGVGGVMGGEISEGEETDSPKGSSGAAKKTGKR